MVVEGGGCYIQVVYIKLLLLVNVVIRYLRQPHIEVLKVNAKQNNTSATDVARKETRYVMWETGQECG